jgi:hypothetical protein
MGLRSHYTRSSCKDIPHVEGFIETAGVEAVDKSEYYKKVIAIKVSAFSPL